MPRRRLGCLRQGSHAALARGHALCGSQRDSRSDLQRPDRAHARTAWLHRLRRERELVSATRFNTSSTRRKTTARGMGAGASITFTAPGRCCAACAPSARYDAGLDSARRAIGSRAARTRTAAGVKPAPLRQSGAQRQRREHGSQTAWALMGICAWATSIGRACSAVCVTCSVRQQRRWLLERAANHRHRFSGVFYLKYDMYRSEFSAARAGHLPELPHRFETSAQRLSLRRSCAELILS